PAFRVFVADFHAEDRADHTGLGARAGANRNGIETILLGERVAGVGVAQARADDAPFGGAGGEQVVDDNRLMRPVKCADAEMNDAGFDGGSIVAGPTDAGWEPIDGGVGEAQNASNRGLKREFSADALTCSGISVNPLVNWSGQFSKIGPTEQGWIRPRKGPGGIFGVPLEA